MQDFSGVLPLEVRVHVCPSFEGGTQQDGRGMGGGIFDGNLQELVFVLEERGEDVFEARSRERVGVPALHHQVVDDQGAPRRWR